MHETRSIRTIHERSDQGATLFDTAQVLASDSLIIDGKSMEGSES